MHPKRTVDVRLSVNCYKAEEEDCNTGRLRLKPNMWKAEKGSKGLLTWGMDEPSFSAIMKLNLTHNPTDKSNTGGFSTAYLSVLVFV